MRGAKHVFAVVRVDLFKSAESPPEGRITIKEILPTQDEAESEVNRLTALNTGKDVVYFWQTTRFFPEGRGQVSND